MFLKKEPAKNTEETSYNCDIEKHINRGEILQQIVWDMALKKCEKESILLLAVNGERFGVQHAMHGCEFGQRAFI